MFRDELPRWNSFGMWLPTLVFIHQEVFQLSSLQHNLPQAVEMATTAKTTIRVHQKTQLKASSIFLTVILQNSFSAVNTDNVSWKIAPRDSFGMWLPTLVFIHQEVFQLSSLQHNLPQAVEMATTAKTTIRVHQKTQLKASSIFLTVILQNSFSAVNTDNVSWKIAPRDSFGMWLPTLVIIHQEVFQLSSLQHNLPQAVEMATTAKTTIRVHQKTQLKASSIFLTVILQNSFSAVNSDNVSWKIALLDSFGMWLPTLVIIHQEVFQLSSLQHYLPQAVEMATTAKTTIRVHQKTQLKASSIFLTVILQNSFSAVNTDNVSWKIALLDSFGMWLPTLVIIHQEVFQLSSHQHNLPQAVEMATNCEDNNPCTPENAAQGKFHFPHSDPSKFVQCSEFGQCFVKDCPAELVWDVIANTCNYPSGGVPTVQPPTQPPSSGGNGYNCEDNNPCTPENAAQGKFHFPHSDPSKFVQCSEHGQCFVKNCPAGLVWDVVANTCNYPSGGVPTVQPPTQPPSSGGNGYNCEDNNPCTPENAAQGKFHFPHSDPSKFVQCSEHGQCFVKDCPAGLVWDVVANTCNYPSGGVPTVQPPTQPPSSGGNGYKCEDNNPCTPENAVQGKFHFPHSDPSKFVQCSEHGKCFVKDCPAGLVWDVVANTCNYPSGRCSNCPATNTTSLKRWKWLQLRRQQSVYTRKRSSRQVPFSSQWSFKIRSV